MLILTFAFPEPFESKLIDHDPSFPNIIFLKSKDIISHVNAYEKEGRREGKEGMGRGMR